MVLSREIMEQRGSNIYCPTIFKALQKPCELIDFLKKVKSKQIEVDLNEIKHFEYFFYVNEEERALIYEILGIKNSKWVVESMNIEESELVNDSLYVYNSRNVRSSHDIKSSEKVEGSSTVVGSTGIFDSKFIFNSNYVECSTNIRDCINIKSTSCTNNSNSIFNSDNIENSFGIEYSSYLKNCYFCKMCYKLDNGILCYSLTPFSEGKYFFCNNEITKERFEGYVDTIKMLMENTFNGTQDKKIKGRELKNFYEWALGLPEADESYINAILKKGRYNI